MADLQKTLEDMIYTNPDRLVSSKALQTAQKVQDLVALALHRKELDTLLTTQTFCRVWITDPQRKSYEPHFTYPWHRRVFAQQAVGFRGFHEPVIVRQ